MFARYKQQKQTVMDRITQLVSKARYFLDLLRKTNPKQTRHSKDQQMARGLPGMAINKGREIWTRYHRTQIQTVTPG